MPKKFEDSIQVSGTVTGTLFSGSGASLTNIPNSALTNSSLTVGTTNIALGNTTLTIAGLTSVQATTFTGSLTGAATTAGTVTVAAQPSITSLGTLTSLAVTGAITGASFNTITGLSSTTPLMDGTATIGSGTTIAYANHVHPVDTSRQTAYTNLTAIGSLTNANGVLTNNGSGSFSYSTPLVNPMSAVGDIIVGGTSGAANKLAIGSSGQVLTVASGTPSWATPTTLATTLSGYTVGSNTVLSSSNSILTAFEQIQGQINNITANYATTAWVTANFTSNKGGSCFPANSMVLMADQSWKPIQNIVVGDEVIGIDGQPNKVYELLQPQLGDRPLLTFDDNSLITSAEHTIWSMKDGQEWFSTRNSEQLKLEASLGIGADLEKPIITNDTWDAMDYAHLDGFKNKISSQIKAPNNMKLYQLHVDRSRTYIVNGYVVGSIPDDRTFDYISIKWDQSRAAIPPMAQDVRDLINTNTNKTVSLLDMFQQIF